MCTLYIGGLPASADLGTVTRLLAAFRGLVRAQVITEDTGVCRGFAYATFETEEAAFAVQTTLDGIEYGALRLRVAVAV